MTLERRTTAMDRTGKPLSRELTDRSKLRLPVGNEAYARAEQRSAIRYIASRMNDSEQLAEILDILGLDAQDGK